MGRAPAPEPTSLALALLLREEKDDVDPSEDGVRRCEREKPCGERGRMGGGSGIYEGAVVLSDKNVE